MHVKSIRLKSFRRFSDITITGIPSSTRLVMLVGTNGSGKSSVFDAFRFWHIAQGGPWANVNNNQGYYQKQSAPTAPDHEKVSIEFHEEAPATEPKKVFYIRSAYRHQPELAGQASAATASIYDAPYAPRLIDPEARVDDDYARMVSSAVAELFAGGHGGLTLDDFADQMRDRLNQPMSRVFDDLTLTSLGNPAENRDFYFTKGISTNFPYKNLSAGEKATFDIILDLVVKQAAYDDTIYCIDEPGLHMHTSLESRLLREIADLIPQSGQLWIAGHSIGVMKAARDLQERHPDRVVFLDFDGRDVDQPVVLTPAQVNREFWAKHLEIALGDIAALVAPRAIVLCEGWPADNKPHSRAERDAACYRTIFAEHRPDTEFLSVGNADAVENDHLGMRRGIETLVKGTTVIQLIDRDDRSDIEVAELGRQGIRVLSLRHLESFLLDDEILGLLCLAEGQGDKTAEVLAAKEKALQDSVARGNQLDDLKSAAGTMYVEVKKILKLTGRGNTVDSFLRDTLAPLVTPDAAVYKCLEQDIFG